MKKFILLALGLNALTVVTATTSVAQAAECEGRYKINANNHFGELVINQQHGDNFDGTLGLDGKPIEWVRGSCSARFGTINFYRPDSNQVYKGHVDSDGWNLELRGTFTFQGRNYEWNATMVDDGQPQRPICAGTFEIEANAFVGTLELRQVDKTRVAGWVKFRGEPSEPVRGECSKLDNRTGTVRFVRDLRSGDHQLYNGDVWRRGGRVEMSGRFIQTNDTAGRNYFWIAH